MSSQNYSQDSLSGLQNKQQNEHWTTQTIQESLAWMSKFAQPDRVAYLVQQSSYLSIDRALYHRLMNWTTSLSSEALWVEGPAITIDPSSNMLTTALVATGFQNKQVPIISFFCSHNPRRHRPLSRSAELLRLVFSLIYQVSTILPSDLSDFDMPDLTASRFDEDRQSLPGAIELLGDMLALSPPLFACFIDGLELLDSEGGSERYKACFKRFVEVLGEAKSRPRRIVKMWLSTDGHSGTLQHAVGKGWVQTYKTEYDSQGEPLVIEMARVARLGS